MQRKQRWLTIVFIVFTVLLTTGCNNVKVFYYGSNFGNEINGKYTYFKGTETKKINLKEGDVLMLEYTSVVESGTLKMSLFDPNEQKVTEFEANQTGSFEYMAKTSGSYQLAIIGEKTKGEFHISWEVE